MPHGIKLPCPQGFFSLIHKRTKSPLINLLGWTHLSYWTLMRRLFTSRATKASQCYSSSCSKWTKRSSNAEVFGKSSIASFNKGILHSTGKTESNPCTRWYGEKSVAVLTAVLYAHKVGYNMICQFVLLCANGSLENGIKWFIHCFNLFILLRVIRRGVLLLIP